MVAAPTAREVLRHATGEAHGRLHAVPVFASLAEGRITLPDYVALLRRLLGFHLGLEAALLPAAPALLPYGIVLAERRRAGLARADLAHLGAPPLAEVLRFAAPPGAAAALGCLYVAEGSTLGGRVLAARLDGLLPEGEAGRRFLLGHGARHGEMWRTLCTAIEACGAERSRLTAMVGGARQTFAAFEAWFTMPDMCRLRHG